jgi:hypothetical protein
MKRMILALLFFSPASNVTTLHVNQGEIQAKVAYPIECTLLVEHDIHRQESVVERVPIRFKNRQSTVRIKVRHPRGTFRWRAQVEPEDMFIDGSHYVLRSQYADWYPLDGQWKYLRMVIHAQRGMQ